MSKSDKTEGGRIKFGHMVKYGARSSTAWRIMDGSREPKLQGRALTADKCKTTAVMDIVAELFSVLDGWA